MIYNIVEKTISERIEKGELTRTVGPKKSKKITVTEAQLRQLQEKGIKLDSIKKKKLTISEDLKIVWDKSRLIKIIYQDGKPYFNKPTPYDSIEDLLKDVEWYKNHESYKDIELVVN